MRLRGIRATTTVAVAAAVVIVGPWALSSAEAAAVLPAVSSAAATTGSTHGGVRVVVTGSHFTSVRSVRFGVATGRSVRVLSATRLQVTTPAHAAGVVDVRVLTRSGLSRVRSADRYRYVAPPAVSAVSTRTGPVTGGTRVTVTGSGFTRVTAVRFGSSTGTALRVLSSSRLQVTAPVRAAGAVDVRVWNSYGGSAIRTADRFTYHAAVSGVPAVVAVASEMTVVGHGFRPKSTARLGFDTDSSTVRTFVVSTSGTFSAAVVVPDGLADGTHHVGVVGTDGSGAPVNISTAVYVDLAAPVVSAVTVPTHSVSPGDTITLTAHVTDVAGVGLMILDVQSVSDQSLACTGKAALHSGTVHDGIWSRSCTIDANTVDGTYQVVPWGDDVFGNWVNANDGPPAPQPTFTVARP